MFEAAKGILPHWQVIPYNLLGRERRLARFGLSGRSYFNSVVLGGGTLINVFTKRLVRLALSQGLRVSAIGTGVGSPGWGVEAALDPEWKSLLRQFARVGVRGPVSKAALDALEVPHVQIVGDLAFVLGREMLVPPEDPPTFVLNVTVAPAGSGERWEYDDLIELECAAQNLVANGWRPVPVAMNERDVEPLRRVLAKVWNGEMNIPIVRTADEFFSLVSRCTMGIVLRLHAGILSACVGVPSVMLGYREKCLDFMGSVQLEEWYISPRERRPGQISWRVKDLSERALMLRPVLLERIAEYRRGLHRFVHEAVEQP